METGSNGSEDMKHYDILHKMEAFGEKAGLRVNKKITKLGYAAVGVATVVIFGGWAIIRTFFKNATKK